MEIFPEQIDYIISYRESAPDRKIALHFVTAWLHKTFPDMNVVIVEQDTSPKLKDSELPNCQRIFIYNPGLFNRGWSCNVGASATNKPYLIFGDADIFMPKSAYLECFHYLQEFEAVDPKKNYVYNVNNIALDPLSYQSKNIRYGNTFAGGIFLIRRQSFLSLGMWDEDFEGWGGEDNVMEHVIRSYLRHCRLQLDVFHINHHRTADDGNKQPQYLYNSKLSRLICSLHGERLQKYMENKKKRNPASKYKYRNLSNDSETGKLEPKLKT